MRRVTPFALWLGNTLALRDLRAIHDARIAVIVDLAANEKPPTLTRDLTYLRFPLVDGVGNPPWQLKLAIDCIAELLKARVPTLVACSAGMSRTPAIAAAALSLHTGSDFATTLESIIAGAAHDVSPSLISEVQSVLAAKDTP